MEHRLKPMTKVISKYILSTKEDGMVRDTLKAFTGMLPSPEFNKSKAEKISKSEFITASGFKKYFSIKYDIPFRIALKARRILCAPNLEEISRVFQNRKDKTSSLRKWLDEGMGPWRGQD